MGCHEYPFMLKKLGWEEDQNFTSFLTTLEVNNYKQFWISIPLETKKKNAYFSESV